MLRALWLVVAHDLLEYRYMDDVRKMFMRLFRKKKKLPKKFKRELFTKKRNEEKETKRVLDKLRMPKLQEIFTAVPHDRLAVLQNGFAIILLWASEGAKVLFREPVYVVVQFCSYVICTSPILHLICPAKFCTSIVFNFPWDSCNTQGKWNEKKKGYAKFWEANKVLYGRCASGVWFNFYFPLFIIMSYHTQKQRKIIIEKRIKLNYNIDK